MAGSWITDRFPSFAEDLRRLVAQHREIEDQPLHLALAYQPAARDPQHIFLFEVIGGTHWEPNSEGDLFETSFLAASGFPLAPGQELHLILTNERELEVALREHWPLAEEIVAAVRDGDYQVLHLDEVGRRELDRIQASARTPELSRG